MISNITQNPAIETVWKQLGYVPKTVRELLLEVTEAGFPKTDQCCPGNKRMCPDLDRLLNCLRLLVAGGLAEEMWHHEIGLTFRRKQLVGPAR